MAANSSYLPEDIPAVGDNRSSRYALNVSPGGWGSTPSKTIAMVYSGQLANLVESAERAAPPVKTVALRLVRPALDGGYELVSRGEVTAQQVLVNRAPGKFQKLTLSAGALTDSLLSGVGEGFDRARDDQLFDALLELVETVRPDGETCRRLSDLICLAILARSGIIARPDSLPMPS